MLKRKDCYDLRKSSEQIIGFESQDSAINRTGLSNVKRPCWSSYMGIVYVFFACITILLSNIFVKKISYIDPGQLSMVRNMGVFFGNLPIAIYSTSNIFGEKEDFWRLITRSFIGATSLYLNLMAFRLLDLADASIIMATVPSLVTIAAKLYLKEPCGNVQVISIFLTFLGVIISVRIPVIMSTNKSERFTKAYVVGLACAFGCVLTLTYMYVSLRAMKNIHFSVILIYLGSLGIIENAAITALTSTFSWCNCGNWDSIQVMLIGVLGFLGHSFMVLSAQAETASIASTSKAAIDVFLAIVFQFLFFDSIPDLYTLSGGALVCIAIILISLWKWLLNQPEDAVCRKRFKWILL